MTIVLAYSGGLDTSVLLKKFVLDGHRVIALTLDLGESDGTAGAGASAALVEVKAKALALGAYDALLVDAKERFVADFALKALRANGEGARFVAGSVTGADETRKRTIAATRLKLHPRGLEGFAPLAAKAGFRIAKSERAMISDQVLLRPV